MKIITHIGNAVQEHPIMRKILRYPLGRRFLTDMVFRTKLSLFSGLIINFMYSAVQLVFGICNRSVWSGALSVFYVLLAVMRYNLLKPEKNVSDEQDNITGLRKYRFCGIILLFMTPFFASILILIVHKNSGAEYPGSMLYLMAVYALCFIMISIVNLLKFRMCGNPVISAAKVINLTIALISVLSFETAAV